MTSKNPATRIGPRNWSRDTFDNIMAAVQLMKDADFLRALLLVSRDTDWSTAWLMSFRWSQLAPDGTIVLRPQGETVPAVVQLSPEALAALQVIQDARDRTGRVFVLSSAFDKKWRKVQKLAGIDLKAAVLPHWSSFRRVPEQPVELVSDGQPKSLIGFYESVYFIARLSGKSKRTDELYRFSIRNFSRYLGREAMLDDLTDANLLGLLNWMREKKSKTGEPVSSWTLAKEYDQLCAIWRLACLRHLVREPPTIQRPQRPRKSPLAWTQEELAAIFKQVDSMEGYYTNGLRIKSFWRALLYICWVSGERITAILNLKWKHIDLKGGWLNVPAELRKGNKEDKLSKLPPYVVEALEAIASPPRELVFEWTFNTGYLWSKYGEILKAAGLPCDRRSKFHRIRKSTASHFEAAKGDATELLGHTSRDITRKHYLDRRIVVPVHAGDVLFRPDEPRAEIVKPPEQLAEVAPEVEWL